MRRPLPIPTTSKLVQIAATADGEPKQFSPLPGLTPLDFIEFMWPTEGNYDSAGLSIQESQCKIIHFQKSPGKV